MLSMDKNDFRSLIKHYFLRGKTAKETKEKLDKYYGANAPSDYTVKYWFREFRGGRNSTTDQVRSGRPSDAVTEDNVKKIHEMVLADRKVKVRELADTTKISTERTRHILGNILHMKKLSCRWVPRMLTPDQKHERESTSKECLDLLMRNRADFWRRLVTVDETWIHYYTPENRMSARQWTEAGTSAPKRPREAQWVGKVMASVFWDCHGILFVDYLEKGKTINSEYYCALLERLKAEIAAKRPHMKRKKILFLQDNAPAHKSIATTAKINDLRLQLLSHPPYSPDLAPSDYYLFPNLKRWLINKKFSSREEIIDATEEYFADLPENYFSDGIKKLENRWNKCIELKGDYIE